MAIESKQNLDTILQLEEFLDDLEDSTGVSREFLDAARPIVCRLFTEIPSEDRPQLAQKVREAVGRHAEMEFRVDKVAAMIESPDASDPIEAGFDTNLAAGIFLYTHGGFGRTGTGSA